MIKKQTKKAHKSARLRFWVLRFCFVGRCGWVKSFGWNIVYFSKAADFKTYFFTAHLNGRQKTTLKKKYQLSTQIKQNADLGLVQTQQKNKKKQKQLRKCSFVMNAE